jgi:hypothetical protein
LLFPSAQKAPPLLVKLGDETGLELNGTHQQGRSQGGVGRGLAPPMNVKFPLIFFEI